MIKRVKCEGRFNQLREYLFSYLVPNFTDKNNHITLDELDDMWSLLEDDIFRFDLYDNYYNKHVSDIRLNPQKNKFSMVPLFPCTYSVDKVAIQNYLQQEGNSEKLIDKLSLMSNQQRRILSDVGDFDPGEITFSNKKTLQNYLISGNAGIGTISQGGIAGGGIRSDSPFLLEVSKINNSGEVDLAGVIGFWAQKNYMIISQLQECKNAKFPKNISFGEGTMRVAEEIGERLGFEGIKLYHSEYHPLVLENKQKAAKFASDLRSIFDKSALKLDYQDKIENRIPYFQKDF